MDTAEVPWSAVAAHPTVITALTGATRLRTLRPVGEVGSTQDRAREHVRDGAPDGTLVLADVQRRGRGRTGGTWDDDVHGGSLAMTVVLDVALTAGTLPLLPFALGVAVVDACAVARPTVDLRLKWPNDVVVRDTPQARLRKLAGVLVERERIPTTDGAREVVLCGIGLNVTLRGPVVADRTDLATLVATPPDRAELLAGLIGALERSLQHLDDPPRLLDRVRALSDTVGRRVRVLPPGEPALVGTAVAIDDSGRLVVDADGRRRAILSGTVRDEEA